MALPNPDNYSDWKEFAFALLKALDGGVVADLLVSDNYASGYVQSALNLGQVPEGFAPLWLSEGDANLYLGNNAFDPPTAPSLFFIDTLNLADLAVDLSKIADNAVSSAKIIDLAVVNAKIADATILSAKIGDLQVTQGKIADLAVNDAKIANLAVTSGKVANLAVGTAAVQDAAITNAKIANLAVDAAKIANLAVGTAQIDNGAITNAKIGSLAVGSANIQTAAITAGKIDALAVGTAAIQDLAVGTLKIAGYAVDPTKIESEAVIQSSALYGSGAQAITVAGGQVNVVLASVTMELTFTTENITGSQGIIIFARVTTSGAVADIPVTLELYRDGTTSVDSFNAVVQAGSDLVTCFFLDGSPGQNTTRTYTLQAAAPTTSYFINSVALVGMLVKR